MKSTWGSSWRRSSGVGSALFLAAFLVSWRPLVDATHYAVERSAGDSAYVQVAYGTGLQFVDTAIVSGGFYVYRQRAWDGARWSTYSNERTALYVDFSRASLAPYKWHVYTGPETTLVYVDLPSAAWSCEVSNTFTLRCWTCSDFNGDATVNLSDFALIVEAYYGTVEWLSRLAWLAQDYNKSALQEWPR